MTPRVPLAAILALAAICASAVADQDDALRLERAGEILPLTTVLDRARAHRPGNVLDVELEREHGRYVYEVILLDERGRVWELEIDASTGIPIDSPKEDD